jgi:hypothetical protein
VRVPFSTCTSHAAPNRVPACVHTPRLAVVSRSVHSIPQLFTVACARTVAHTRRVLAHHCSSAVDAAAACSLRSGRTAERWHCHCVPRHCTARHADTNPNSLAIPTDRSRFVRTPMRAALPSVGCELLRTRVLPLHCEFRLGFSQTVHCVYCGRTRSRGTARRRWSCACHRCPPTPTRPSAHSTSACEPCRHGIVTHGIVPAHARVHTRSAARGLTAGCGPYSGEPRVP